MGFPESEILIKYQPESTVWNTLNLITLKSIAIRLIFNKFFINLLVTIGY